MCSKNIDVVRFYLNSNFKTFQVYSVEGNDDPTTAKAEIQHKMEMQYFASNDKLQQRINILTTNIMTADQTNFYLEEELNVSLNGEPFFSKNWDKVVPRNFV